MPVTFDNVAASLQTATAQATLVLTSTSNAVLVVFAGSVTGTGSISSIEYGGVPLTKYAFAGDAQSSGVYACAYVLTAPAAGAITLSAAFSTATRIWHITGMTYANAKAINPFGTAISGTGAATAVINFTVSSTSTDLVAIGVICLNDLVASNMTNRQNSNTHYGWRAGDIAGTAGVSISVSATTSAAGWAYLAIPVQFSAVSVTTIAPFTMAMTGVGR